MKNPKLLVKVVNSSKGYHCCQTRIVKFTKYKYNSVDSDTLLQKKGLFYKYIQIDRRFLLA